MDEQKAQLRYLRIAPRKVRLVADLVRGLTLNEAEARLTLLSQRAAKPLLKLLRSAAANAKATKQLSPDKLYIKTIQVDQGPMLERYLPRARGSATPIQKKMSHVQIVLGESAEPRESKFKIIVVKKKKSEKAPAKKKGAAKKPEGETVAKPKEKNLGFFRRHFSRKAV